MHAAIQYATGEWLTFKTTQKKVKNEKGEEKEHPYVTITDGEKLNIKIQTEDATYFPETLKTDNENSVTLTPEVMEAITLCSRHVPSTLKEGQMQWFLNLYITDYDAEKKESLVFGTNGSTMYYRIIKGNLPKLALMPYACQILGSISSANYSKVGNFDLFEAGKITYGFIGVEAIPARVDTIIKGIQRGQPIIIDRKKLLNFCEQVEMVNPVAFSMISAESPDASAKELVLKYENNEFERESDTTIPLYQEIKSPKVFFNTKYVIMALRSMASETITFYDYSYTWYGEGEQDPGFGLALRQLVENPVVAQ